MSEPRKVLVIIDPTKDLHIALERTIITSEVHNPGSHVHLFIGVDSEANELKASNQTLYKDQTWLKSITDSLDNIGVSYSFELCWSNEWQEAVLNCANRFQPDHIFMPDYKEDKKFSLFSKQQWALLRKSTTPITIVRPGTSGQRKIILAAVNVQKDDDPRYEELNEKILTQGMAIAKHYDAEFFVINAYADSSHYPNREKILKITQLPTQNVHVEEGQPADVISGYAKTINADTIILGTLARKGTAAFMKGNTSEKVLRKLTQDVIIYS